MHTEDAGRSASPLTEGLDHAAPERAEVAHLDDGEAWSFCRTVIADGRDILQWHPDEGYERQSARMDAQAAYRGDQLMAMVRALVAAERERAVLAFAEFLHSMPEEDGYAVGPVRVKYSPAGLLLDGPLWATQEDTARWARAFLAGPNVRGNLDPTAREE